MAKKTEPIFILILIILLSSSTLAGCSKVRGIKTLDEIVSSVFQRTKNIPISRHPKPNSIKKSVITNPNDIKDFNQFPPLFHDSLSTKINKKFAQIPKIEADSFTDKLTKKLELEMAKGNSNELDEIALNESFEQLEKWRTMGITVKEYTFITVVLNTVRNDILRRAIAEGNVTHKSNKSDKSDKSE